LITGIGGLGKTTLAFRFAEEVVETAAGQIEWVIWMTAKAQTYSALRGKLVETGSVDFSGLRSLYEAILRTLSFELIESDDTDTSLEELSDRVIEALSYYSCLIVVDDIDSLSPEEQRETVSALNAIALRTVGRDFIPSRVLLTSRIDQGLSPTAVQKITGLEPDAFESHVSNLCQTFSIPKVPSSYLPKFYSATSGSPLFAASIVRLVKLGENLTDVVATWRGQEGVEVRRFAFERELRQLDPGQGRLLYAVLLLGETSVVDLATVLDVSQAVVRDRISELQSYHLLSTRSGAGGSSSIVAPADLLSVIEILREHLSIHAKSVEQACAEAQNRSKSANRSVGAAIREVVSLWDANRDDEAAIAAEKVRDRFPKNADVASVLGAAYLRVSPSRSKEADKELMRAYGLRCSRPELVPNIIRAKTDISDWSGIYELTKGMYSRERNRDVPLSAFLSASRQLLRTAQDRGDFGRSAEIAVLAAERVADKMQHSLDKTFFSTLQQERTYFASQYVLAVERDVHRPGDALSVFEAVARLSNAGIVLVDVLRRGMTALQRWWTDVEQRPFVDVVAVDILSSQLRRLDRIKVQLVEFQREDQVIEDVSKLHRDLSYRAARLLS
jgi:DNA-binding IscR family transcriptional regulator